MVEAPIRPARSGERGHKIVQSVTQALIERSKPTREAYLARMDKAKKTGPRRGGLGCANIAHSFAACPAGDKAALHQDIVPNLAIVTSYNDMLSAHQPFERFPEIIRQAARDMGAVAQVAGGVPAMCDGVTQGRAGMELSLFSRDVIALATGVALSHDVFDAAVYLGVCDKIVPGLVMGALAFGHVPAVFIPAGPMPSGLPNEEKAKIRQLYAEGKATRADLLESESKSYHGPGTCTFYGTANSNQMLMEVMGLHLPGASFVNPNTPLRDALTRHGARRALQITALGNDYTPIGSVLDARAFVNGVVALHATGGSTNHVIHLIAMARAAGHILTLDDFAALSEAVPLLCRIYPNGSADVNHFHAAGGLGFLINELLSEGLLHGDAATIAGMPLADYGQEPFLKTETDLDKDALEWRKISSHSHNTGVLRGVKEPFAEDGGLKILNGNLGRAVMKVSAVKPEHRKVTAKAKIFHAQEELEAAFKAGALNEDFIAVVRFQGPRAIGMPELHKLTPALSSLQSRGLKVALVTDGRMSGASGKIPAAIHVTPEAQEGGPISLVHEGDVIELDGEAGVLRLLVEDEVLARRQKAIVDLTDHQAGLGRELFAPFRAAVSTVLTGASIFG